MSYQRLTPFATLGRPMEKQAFMQGMKDVGNGLWNTAAGKLNTQGISMGQDLRATGAGLSGMSGGFHGAGAAADKSYNADNAAKAQQTQRANSGWDQAKAGVGGMVSSVGKYFGGIGDAVMGNSPTAPAATPKPVGAPPAAAASTPAKPPATGPFGPGKNSELAHQRAGMQNMQQQMNTAGVTSGTFTGGQLQSPSAAPQPAAPAAQPDMNQFNQPGGWTTGPNGETVPMQKQSAFAQLGKSAYANYLNMGTAIPASAPAPRPQFRSHGGTSPAAIAGRQSTGASPSAPPEVRNEVAAQAGVPLIMPDQIRAATSGPTAENIAAFRKQTGTNYDAKSKMDMQNMRRLMGGADTMDHKQYGMAQQLAGPQPMLDKTAGIGSMIGKGIMAGGKILMGKATTQGAGLLNKARQSEMGQFAKGQLTEIGNDIAGYATAHPARAAAAAGGIVGGSALMAGVGDSRSRNDHFRPNGGSPYNRMPQRGGLDMRDAFGTGGMGRPMPAMPPLTGIQSKTTISPDFDSEDGMKTAFAMLEKEALAKGVSKLLSAGGQFLRGSARKAKSTAGRWALDAAKGQDNMLGSMDEATKLRIHQDASGAAGNIRASAGRGLSGAADSIDASKGIQNAINYGGGTALAGAGLYGANRMGHNSGMEEGLTEGVDQGLDLGLRGAQAMQPGDPGFMGRLGDLFTGTQSGPDASTMRQGLSTERDKLIQSLLAR